MCGFTAFLGCLNGQEDPFPVALKIIQISKC
jgi:hypothetical protein